MCKSQRSVQGVHRWTGTDPALAKRGRARTPLRCGGWAWCECPYMDRGELWLLKGKVEGVQLGRKRSRRPPRRRLPQGLQEQVD